MIQIDDVEMISHSSEQRDKVPSLRENKVPITKLQQAESVMNEIPFMKRIDNVKADKPAQTKQEAREPRLGKDEKTGPPKEKGSSSQRQWKKPSARRRKKETELEFTRRLLAENPRGLKGLAYVLI